MTLYHSDAKMSICLLKRNSIRYESKYLNLQLPSHINSMNGITSTTFNCFLYSVTPKLLDEYRYTNSKIAFDRQHKCSAIIIRQY